MCGWGYSFSMWQTCKMWQMLSKCILVHFVPHFGTFCTGLSRAKAVPLHRISKRAETTQTTQTTKTTKNYANNYEPTYLPPAQLKHKGRV